METECRIPSRKRTCWSFDIRVLCRRHERRTRAKLVCCQSWFAFIVKSSSATLHQEHSIESRWHLKNPPIPVFVGNLKRWQVHNLSLVDCAQIDRTCCDPFMSHFKVFGSYGSLFWTGMVLRNCGEKLQPASTASSWADHRQLVFFASCIQDDKHTFQLDFKAKPFDKLDMIQS